MNDATTFREAFEPKVGDEELCARLIGITDQDKICLFYNILGAYTAASHEEWQNFRERVERFLPIYERKENC